MKGSVPPGHQVPGMGEGLRVDKDFTGCGRLKDLREHSLSLNELATLDRQEKTFLTKSK